MARDSEAMGASRPRYRLHHPRRPRRRPARGPRPTNRRLPRHSKPDRFMGYKVLQPRGHEGRRTPRAPQHPRRDTYALRRGGISLRLRAEDPQTVASECGTSLQMLSAHYAFAIQDLRQHGPRPADVEWRAARAARIARSHEEDPSASIKAAGQGGRRRKSFFAWLSARKRAPRA